MMRSKFVIFVFLLSLSACQSGEKAGSTTPAAAAPSLRIVSLSGFLTEVLYELGYGDQIVGTDITSTYPEAVEELPKLGHVSQLNAEALLALHADLIFVEQRQANNEVLDQIADADVRIVEVPTTYSLDNALQAALAMQEPLQVPVSKIEQLRTQIERDQQQLNATLSQFTKKPKVLFIYARGAGRLSVAGLNTSAAAIIEQAGGQNAITHFEDFKVLTPEALVGAAPDVILMFSSGLASLDGPEGLSQIPGMTQTPAFKQKRIVTMDGHYLTAFGPRAAQAAEELARAIHEVPNL